MVEERPQDQGLSTRVVALHQNIAITPSLGIRSLLKL